jgi:hypothetical protein
MSRRDGAKLSFWNVHIPGSECTVIFSGETAINASRLRKEQVFGVEESWKDFAWTGRRVLIKFSDRAEFSTKAPLNLTSDDVLRKTSSRRTYLTATMAQVPVQTIHRDPQLL